MRLSKFTYFLLALLAPLFLASCSEEDNTVEEFPDWENTNNAYFASLYNYAAGVTDGSWKVIKNFTFNDDIEATAENSIVVEVLEAGRQNGARLERLVTAILQNL